MMSQYREQYEKWMSFSGMTDDLKKELEEIKGDDNAVKERFFKPLEFGTAGLRGVIGAGTNRMNIFVVRQATQGLCEVIKSQNAADRGVVIAYDSRKYSDLFARESARVLAANGIKAYLFEDLRPVPELSFAIRQLGTIAGIVITASHNPYQYNGYKAYWEDGSQLPPQFAKEVFDVIVKTDIFAGIKIADFDKAVEKGMIEIIGSEMDEAFIEEVLKLSIHPDAVAKVAEHFKIIYTPFHGTGNKPVREVLRRAGHKNVIVVKEQEKPDPMFSTVKSPNPEDKEGFQIAINDYAKKYDVDLIIGTDPDCDRVGIVVKASNGEYITMTGNQVGVLLTHYILSGLKDEGKLPENGVVIKSIVSTKMVKAICDTFGIELMNVLTGFKFIGEKIKEFEQTHEHTFLFGFEESYGYLSGTHARDKDGVNACMLIAEMAAYYKAKNMSLYDALTELFRQYGFYKESVLSITHEGLDGMEKIKNTMLSLRENPLTEIGGIKILSVSDYLKGKNTCLENRKETVINLPQADVLAYDLEDETTIFIRPSGTEPKIKGYIMVCDKEEEKATEKIIKYTDILKQILD
jgi:phosphoglucomutase